MRGRLGDKETRGQGDKERKEVMKLGSWEDGKKGQGEKGSYEVGKLGKGERNFK